MIPPYNKINHSVFFEFTDSLSICVEASVSDKITLEAVAEIAAIKVAIRNSCLR